MKKILQKTLDKLQRTLDNENLRHSFSNAGYLYLGFKAADIFLNYYGFEHLNDYNSLEHLAAGGFIGTWAYKMAGGGLKGVLWGFGAATLGNSWELVEPFIPKYNGESFLDTSSDVAVVYLGSALGFYLEGFKPRRNENRRKKTSQPEEQ